MEQFNPGKYSGEILLLKRRNGFVTSITNYSTNNFNGAVHYHNNVHFSFLLSGGCVEKKKDPYEINPGQITYYSAGEVHQVINIPHRTRRVNLEIEPSFFKDYGIEDNVVRTVVMRNPEAKFIMVKICQELLANDSDSETSIHMLLLQLITEMQKAKTDKGEPSWVESARDFLHSHSNNVTTLDDLSRISNLHPVNISKLFPKYFACTVGEYKRKLKVEKALAIIKSNPPSLSHVAYECGFFDQSHFIRTFKRLTGYLPSDYHKLQER